MRIYSNCTELMSEMGRELNSYGIRVTPKTYQNKVIEGNESFITKELICQQYCLTSLDNEESLFIFTHTYDWAKAEFEERVRPANLKGVNPGTAYLLNKGMWEEFLNKEGKFDYTYSERLNRFFSYAYGGVERVDTNLNLIIQLLKDDPDTRKAVLSIYNSSRDSNFYDGTKRIPCSMYYDFLIRYDSRGEKQLNICYHQRSSDFIGHFGDDVYLAWKLMEYVAEKVNVKPGYLFHTIDSLHAYKKDWPLLKTNLGKII
jgi:thymidylate synthase